MDFLRPAAKDVFTAKRQRVAEENTEAQCAADAALVVDQVNASVGVFSDANCDALHVSVDAELYDQIDDGAKLTNLQDVKISVSVLPGVYYRVGYDQTGTAVYRQEKSEGPNNLELFLYRDETGWYFSDRFSLQPREDSEKSLLNTYAWAKATQNPPTLPHLPYWAKKPQHGVHIVPLLNVSLEKLAALSETVQILEATVAETLTPDVRGDDDEHAGSSKGGKGEHGKGKDKGKGKGAGGGGWMNMGAILIREILNENWRKLEDLAYKFVVKSKIVFDKVRRPVC